MKPITKKSSKATCKVCGQRKLYISQNGNCINCSTEKVEIARLQIKHKEGPVYEKYIKNMKRSLGVEV